MSASLTYLRRIAARWCGPGHPAAAYAYSEDRRGERPAAHLAGVRGVLQVDGYAGFKRLAGDRKDSSIKLAFCWAHLRRRFYEFHAATRSPLAGEVRARIGKPYEIEADIRGHPAEHRKQARQERSRPIAEALHAWLQDHVGRVSAASGLAEAIRYAIRHWPGLVVFLDDGRVEMDTNPVERAIRPIALNRKNTLFAGSDGGARHWAVAMTLIQTAKLNGREPMAISPTCCSAWCPGRPRRRSCTHCCLGLGRRGQGLICRRPVSTPQRSRHDRPPDQVGRLLEQLSAALPIPARVTPKLQVLLREKNGITVPATCNVTWVSYAGDKGGIVCQLDAGANTSAVFTSLTHLRFDPRLPLARDIPTYQKHRVTRLNRQPQ